MDGIRYKIELFMCSDMKVLISLHLLGLNKQYFIYIQFLLIVLGLNAAHSIYACPFCEVHRDLRLNAQLAKHTPYILSI